MSPACPRFAGDLSAFVDGTLPDKRLEQVSYHLATCAACRDEVAALANLCATLSSCRSSETPAELATRLELIAGDEAGAPLYLSATGGRHPSARRERARVATFGGAAFVAVVMSVVVLAVMIAPEPSRLPNPLRTAREQFSMSAAAISINEAIGAVLLASDRGADLGTSVPYEPMPQTAAATPVSAERAAEMLRGAATPRLSLSGTQSVYVSDGEQYRTARVRVSKAAGEGSQLEVLDANGDRFSAAFLQTLSEHTVRAPEDWRFALADAQEEIYGRSAVRLTATESGHAVAAWWFDEATGLLLWNERYDTDGSVTLAAGFTELELGPTQLSTDAMLVISLEPASASGSAGWCVGLPACPATLAGLPLIAYSSSDREHARSMTLVYSDGFETAVVGWAEGLLGQAQLRADSVAGLPSVEMWQAGPATVWVSTNGSRALLREICAGLPAPADYDPSLGEKIVAGLQRLIRVG